MIPVYPCPGAECGKTSRVHHYRYVTIDRDGHMRAIEMRHCWLDSGFWTSQAFQFSEVAGARDVRTEARVIRAQITGWKRARP